MVADGAEDIQCDGEGAAAFFERDDRLRAGADGMQKGLQLGVQRLLVRDLGLEGTDLGAGGMSFRSNGSSAFCPREKRSISSDTSTRLR